MSDYVTFTARIEPLEWGRATYTILRLPPGITEALGKTRRVEGEIADYPVNLGIAKADVVDTPFLWTGKSFLDASGITPGEEVEVRLRPAPDDAVETPEDVALALRQAEKTAAWEALTPGKQRSHLHQITTAKRPETRANRIAKLIEALA